ncbi:MAG: carbohydrate binding domain-containing protein, partial [Candidatus Methanoperedens sp.]|nr:carbohydrate binding domain-containing protein [Candidatus Methanoperedens sp.]
YQWQKNGVNIPGATGASYTTPPATILDNGSVFRVNVTNSAGSVMSNGAVLTVLPVPSVNLIQNPGFESGKTSWTFYTNGVGTFNAGPPAYAGNNSAKITLTTVGTNMQLYQSGINLEPNTLYQLSFAAYSNTGHDIRVRLFKQ